MTAVQADGIPVKKRLRFKDEDDLFLLREVVGHNPYERTSSWTTIQENMFTLSKKNFAIKTLKEHIDLLIKLWLEKEKMYKDRSGIERDATEKDMLCQNIHELMLLYRKGGKTEKSKKETNLGKISRDYWASANTSNIVIEEIDSLDENFNKLSSICTGVRNHEPLESSEQLPQDSNKPAGITNQVICDPTGNGSNPPQMQENSHVLRRTRVRKRKLNPQRQGLEYLEQYDREQNSLKKKELQLEENKLLLEERRLNLEEMKFDMDQHEREKRMEIEEENRRLEHLEKKQFIELIDKQNKLLSLLINKQLV